LIGYDSPEAGNRMNTLNTIFPEMIAAPDLVQFRPAQLQIRR